MRYIFAFLCLIFFSCSSGIDNLAREKKTQHDHSFVVIAPFKNKLLVQSLENQTYRNFRIAYADDVKELFQKVHEAKDHEIIISLSTKGRFHDEDVLEKLNELYKKYDVWFAYAEAQNARDLQKDQYQPLTSQNLFHSSMRRKFWKPLKFKSFYASLFKKVKIEDFFFQKDFVAQDLDKAFVFPMMEMAKEHVHFISDVFFDYEPEEKPFDQRWNRKFDLQVMSTKPYAPLKNLSDQKAVDPKVDLIAFSYDRPLQLHALLESFYQHVQNFHQIFVIYRSSGALYDRGFKRLKRSFPHVQFIEQDHEVKDFKPLLMHVLKKASPYLLFSVDDIVVTDSIDLKDVVLTYENLGAYFFSLRLGKNIRYCYMGDFDSPIPHHLEWKKRVMAWNINAAKGDWTYPNSLDITLYRKEQVLQDLKSLNFNNPNELEIIWNKAMHNQRKRKIIGLSYLYSKAVNLPLNLVHASNNRNFNLYQKEELIEKYLEGKVMDIQPFFQIDHTSVHMNYVPNFISK